MQYSIRKGVKQDKHAVLELYRSLIGTEECTWTADYPNEEYFNRDTESQGLYCITDRDGQVIAAASAAEEDECLALSCWNPSFQKKFELARVGIRREYQGQGLSRPLLGFVLKDMRERGFDGGVLLVSPNNRAARRAYENIGFTRCGTCHLYGAEWECMQISL